MKNLKTFVEENQGGELLRMNVAFQGMAAELGERLQVGEAYHFIDEKQTDVELFQAVEVSDTFAKVLENFGAVMEPSLEAIDKRFYKDEQFDDMEIRIVSTDATYIGIVGIGNLSKLTSIWMNTNDWKEVGKKPSHDELEQISFEIKKGEQSGENWYMDININVWEGLTQGELDEIGAEISAGELSGLGDIPWELFVK